MNEVEKNIKKMLEVWVSRNRWCSISSYNFIRNEGGYYTVSIMQYCEGEHIFPSLYQITITENEFRIIEIE